MEKRAMFWEIENDKIRCQLCPHFCLISEGQLGLCQTRKNINQELIAINYGEMTSLAYDPLEKKPLYHFKPGKQILSIGTYGCNMKCDFCQNHSISQNRAETSFIGPDEVYRLVDINKSVPGVAFTYNEPFMWYEFIYDTARLIKDNSNNSVVLVTNGYINPEPLEMLLPFVDALNIDLKAFDNSFYQKICKADIAPVLKSIEIAKEYAHVEVTTLMVTEENDSVEEVEAIAKFLSQLDKNIPVHLTRYYPNYKMSHHPTNINKMKKAQNVAMRYLNYVYLGNIPNKENNTSCPNCHKTIIERNYIVNTFLNSNKCRFCGEEIPIIL